MCVCSWRWRRRQRRHSRREALSRVSTCFIPPRWDDRIKTSSPPHPHLHPSLPLPLPLLLLFSPFCHKKKKCTWLDSLGTGSRPAEVLFTRVEINEWVCASEFQTSCIHHALFPANVNLVVKELNPQFATVGLQSSACWWSGCTWLSQLVLKHWPNRLLFDRTVVIKSKAAYIKMNLVSQVTSSQFMSDKLPTSCLLAQAEMIKSVLYKIHQQSANFRHKLKGKWLRRIALH